MIFWWMPIDVTLFFIDRLKKKERKKQSTFDSFSTFQIILRNGSVARDDRQTKQKSQSVTPYYITCGNRYKKSINCWTWDYNDCMRWMKRITWVFFLSSFWTRSRCVLHSFEQLIEIQFWRNFVNSKLKNTMCKQSVGQLSNHKLNKKSPNIIIVRLVCCMCWRNYWVSLSFVRRITFRHVNKPRSSSEHVFFLCFGI